ncbi:MAG TPA: hypothetical protein VMN57_15405 [Anaerolineales bacterium]|nr:hypothetical protein [Anaerolineales bacterium]
MRTDPKIWAFLYVLAVTGGLFYFFRGWSYDDPYITYRYAANLADGFGFVYNPGERVLSTTSPLLALALAGLHRLGADIPATANLLGTFSLAVGGLLQWEIARRLELPAAGWAGLLLYPTTPLLVSTLGSETPIYLALCLGAVSLYLQKKYAAAGVFLSLAVLSRADALVLGALLAADWLIRAFRTTRSPAAVIRSVPLKTLIAPVAVLLPWVLFGWLYFGSPLPATLAAKRAQGLLNPADRFLPGLWDLAGRLAEFPHYWIYFVLIPAGFLVAIKRPAWYPLLLWPVCFAAGYTLLSVNRYPWYYASLFPGALAGAGLALGAWFHGPAGGAPARTGLFAESVRRLRTAGPVLLLLLLFAGQLTDLKRLHAGFDTRFAIYREIGLWLVENTPPDASIGTLEVGIIGFFARPRPMVDFTGLIQPDVATQFRPGYAYTDAAAWAAERYQPDVLVLAGGFGELRQTYMRDRCRSAAEFAGADFGYDRDIVIYVCG